MLAKFPRFKGVAQNNRLILGLVAAASVTTALLGWMLSQAGGYDAQLLPWRKWTGFAVAATCTLAWLLIWRSQPRAYVLSLLGTLVVLVVASRLGASITHGRDFLTRFAPAPLRALQGGNGGAAVAPATKSNLTQPHAFSEPIPPSLQRRRSACTGWRNTRPICTWRVTKR